MVPRKSDRGINAFHALIEATLSDGHPLPLKEDMLVTLGRKAIYSVIDIKDASYHVPLHPETRALTFTSTPLSTLLWKFVVIGLRNGLATFKKAAEWVLREGNPQ